MNELVKSIIAIQGKCIDRYLEIYPRVLTKEIKLPIRIGDHGLTDSGERTVMKEAIKQIEKELNTKFHFLIKPTKEVCDTWIDRANTIRAKM